MPLSEVCLSRRKRERLWAGGGMEGRVQVWVSVMIQARSNGEGGREEAVSGRMGNTETY